MPRKKQTVFGILLLYHIFPRFTTAQRQIVADKGFSAFCGGIPSGATPPRNDGSSILSASFRAERMRFRSTHKKDLLANIFCEKGEKRVMRTSTVCCARALNEGFCIISAKSVSDARRKPCLQWAFDEAAHERVARSAEGGAFPWRCRDSRRFRQGVWHSQIPAKGALPRRRIPPYLVLRARGRAAGGKNQTRVWQKLTRSVGKNKKFCKFRIFSFCKYLTNMIGGGYTISVKIA